MIELLYRTAFHIVSRVFYPWEGRASFAVRRRQCLYVSVLRLIQKSLTGNGEE